MSPMKVTHYPIMTEMDVYLSVKVPQKTIQINVCDAVMSDDYQILFKKVYGKRKSHTKTYNK